MRVLRFALGAVLALVLVWSVSADAEIFRWTDAEGRVHFTQRLDRVPPEHRRDALRRNNVARPSGFSTYSGTSPDPDGSDGGRTPRARRRRGGELEIPFHRDGSLMRVTVRLNDALSAPFYIDTGASGISLPSHLAERLGIYIGPDTPQVLVATANGVVARPVVVLEAVELGAARVEGLRATVNPSMQVGLLGGSFFNNFVYRVDAAEGIITLQPNERVRGGLDSESWRERFRSVRDPLERLEAYLKDRDISRAGERRRLEQRRAELRDSLAMLEDEANRSDVPFAWRE
jgi:clan AA aspartic protease (TIGR02281 family)